MKTKHSAILMAVVMVSSLGCKNPKKEEKTIGAALTINSKRIPVIKATHLIYNYIKDPSFDGSISVTYHTDGLIAYLTEAKNTGGDSVRIYFGKYGTNISDVKDQSWIGKKTVLFVPVNPDGTDYVSTVNGTLVPYNEGNICPPPKCPSNTFYQIASNPAYDSSTPYDALMKRLQNTP